MTTRLDRTLKRELNIEGRPYIVALSPIGMKITQKGRRKGQELRWSDLVSGEAALAVALNASLGAFAQRSRAVRPNLSTPGIAARARAAGDAKAQTEAKARAQAKSPSGAKARRSRSAPANSRRGSKAR